MAGFRRVPPAFFFFCCWRNFFTSLRKYYAMRRRYLHDIILEEYEKTYRNAEVKTDAYVERTVPRMSDSWNCSLELGISFKNVGFVFCRWFRRHVCCVPVSVTNHERSTFGCGLFRLQSKISLSINGTGNLIFNGKTQF